MFKTTFVVIMLLWISPTAHADLLTDALADYKSSSYQGMVDKLERFKPDQKQLSTKYYLLGIGYNRLQNFEKSSQALLQAAKLKNNSPDLWYELGQALYATSALARSLEAFKRSAQNKYKEPESLYYVAHIAQILEDYKTSRDVFAQLIKHPQADSSLVQASRFQLAEVLLSMAETRSDSGRLVESFVIPQFEEAQAINPKSDIAPEIGERLREVKTRYGLDPNRMRNGRVIPEKRWGVGFQQEINFDNNITLATDVPTSQATQKESYIFDSTFNAQYTASFKGRYLIEPNLRINQKKYAETSEPEVFQNDSYDITAGTTFKFEHTAKEQPATFGIGLDYKYIARDRLKQKDRIFYARSITVSFFESLRLTKWGDTTFRFKIKDYTAFQPSLNNTTRTFAVDQIAILPNGTLLIGIFNADFTDVENEDNSTNNYLFRVDHLRPNFIAGFTLSAGFAISFLDTKLQSETRGTEKSYNPSFKLIKRINKNVSMQLTYDYTKNTSLDTARFDYTKHVSGLRFRIKF